MSLQVRYLEPRDPFGVFPKLQTDIVRTKRLRNLRTIRSPGETCPTLTDISKLGQRSRFHLC